MAEKENTHERSTTVKVLEGTVTTMKVTDRAALGMGAVENVIPGVTKAAATTLSEAAPVVGPMAGKTVSFLGRWGGRVAVPLQIAIGGGSAIYHGVKGNYVEMGGDIGGTVGGVGGGILMGAAIGSVVPGVGTVIGGAIGGVIGYFGGEKAGKAIAGHFVKSAAAKEEDRKLQESIAASKSTFHVAGTPMPTPVATPAPAKPPSSPGSAFTKVAQTNADLPAVAAAADVTPTSEVATAPPPAASATAPSPARPENSLGTLLDRSSNMHGSELTNVFQRVTKFADENHLSLGAKFSMASMFLSVLNVVNFGGWANSMIEGLQHFALDAMKGDLINQGPNLAGSSDTRPHQQVASGPAPALAQQPA